MAIAIIPFLIAAATWLGRIGLAALAIGEIRKLTQGQKDTMSEHANQAAASGLPEDEQRKLIAATTYEQVEKAGKNPDDFWAGLSESEKLELKYGPDTVRSAMGRTSMLGTTQTILWVAAAAAAGFGAFRGIPIVSKGLGQLVAARQRGAGATELLTFIEQTKMGILQKVWVPGTVATIAAAGGWLTGALANNMNDAFLWGPTFLDQAAADVEKAAKNKGGGFSSSGSGLTSGSGPRTIIRMVETKKPAQFLGVLFSSKLGKMEHFDRKLDDEITDKEDLEADVKLNVNKWLKTLPGRLGYSIVIRKNPVDETGVQQSGIWATATLFITQLSGPTMPIDTILLGPVNPAMEMELLTSARTIETQVDGIVDSVEIQEVDIPAGSVDIFNKAGERVFPSGDTAPAPAPAKNNFGYAYRMPAKPGDAGQQMFTAEQKSQYIGYGFEIRSEPIYPGTIAAPATVVAPAPAAKPASSSSTLRKGSAGQAVKELQEFLNSRGEDLVVDGIFGMRTDAAVGRFQYANGLVSDGIVGPKTKAAMLKKAIPEAVETSSGYKIPLPAQKTFGELFAEFPKF